eukprot:2562049-Prorocentrum_lima.AAC.1
MTSSLVGSEMCIRDSIHPLCKEEGPGEAHHKAAAARVDRLQRGSHSNPTVSYTHLTLPTICSV